MTFSRKYPSLAPSTLPVQPYRRLLVPALTNGLAMFLYLPFILVLFAVHVYVVRVDRIFPLMMVNGVVLWFLGTNLIGYFGQKKWDKAHFNSYDGFSGLALLYAFILFAAVYSLEHLLELVFLSDFRYVFPYAAAFTPFRALLFVEYAFLFYFGFRQMGKFLMVRTHTGLRKSWWQTWISDTLKNLIIMLSPIVLMMAVQYLPLFISGVVPFVGPSAALVGFMINLEHMLVLLVLIIPLYSWIFRITERITPGALLCAMLVAWFFTSSSVIAPVPV